MLLLIFARLFSYNLTSNFLIYHPLESLNTLPERGEANVFNLRKNKNNNLNMILFFLFALFVHCNLNNSQGIKSTKSFAFSLGH